MALIYSRLPGFSGKLFHFDSPFIRAGGNDYLIVSVESRGTAYLDSVFTVKNLNSGMSREYVMKELIEILQRYAE